MDKEQLRLPGPGSAVNNTYYIRGSAARNVSRKKSECTNFFAANVRALSICRKPSSDRSPSVSLGPLALHQVSPHPCTIGDLLCADGMHAAVRRSTPLFPTGKARWLRVRRYEIYFSLSIFDSAITALDLIWQAVLD